MGILPTHNFSIGNYLWEAFNMYDLKTTFPQAEDDICSVFIACDQKWAQDNIMAFSFLCLKLLLWWSGHRQLFELTLNYFGNSSWIIFFR